MGVIKSFGIQGAENADAGSFSAYDGPLPPPKKPYRAMLKRLELVRNSNKNPMLRVLCELDAADKNSEVAQYDGCPVWANQNVTDQGKGYVNQFLDALSNGTQEDIKRIRHAFWNGGLVVDGDSLGHVLRIGKKAINSPKANIPIYFIAKHKTFEGEKSLDVASWLIKKGEADPGTGGMDEDEVIDMSDEAEDIGDPWDSGSDADSEPELGESPF